MKFQSVLLLAVLLVMGGCVRISEVNGQFKGKRPAENERTFNSSVINNVINQVTIKMKDPQLAYMFSICFPNTLDTTIKHYNLSIPETFVITGDIDAMWLRDSTNQVYPYIQYANQEESLKQLIKGVINRQRFYINLDSYANAFNYEPTGSPWDTDKTTKYNENGERVNAMKGYEGKYLWERKFEIDSLAAFLKLSTAYYKYTRDQSFIDDEWIQAVQNVMKTFVDNMPGTREQDQMNFIPYTFSRVSSQPTESLQEGRLAMGKTCGLVGSAFRPSDDACTYPYNVAGNAMVSSYLNKTAEMISKIDLKQFNSSIQTTLLTIKGKAENMSQSIKEAIYQHGIDQDQQGNKVFAYEVNGFGTRFKMDDANIPSLLSLPFLEFVDVNDTIYQNTRKYVLSLEQNPYFFKGSAGEGIGGPHVGDKYIWPMSIIMRAMTSQDDNEIIECLETLKNTTCDWGFMHESFEQDNSCNFTRSWFAWANTLFGQLILHIGETRPYLIYN